MGDEPPAAHASPTIADTSGATHAPSSALEFGYPFNELLVWAVLTNRQTMALCLWQHGEEVRSLVTVGTGCCRHGLL